MMAHAHMYGHGVPVDYEKAARWLERAAALGDERAARDLAAYRTERGRGGAHLQTTPARIEAVGTPRVASAFRPAREARGGRGWHARGHGTPCPYGPNALGGRAGWRPSPLARHPPHSHSIVAGGFEDTS